MPPADQPAPHRASRASRVAERLAHLRALLRRGRFNFEEAVSGADRMTVAVTLFALLELYKRGEADWEQAESFGEIAVQRSAAPASHRAAADRRVSDAPETPAQDAGRGGETPRRWRRSCRASAPAHGSQHELARTIEALLFLSSDPLSRARAGRRDAGERRRGRGGAAQVLAEQYAPGRRGIHLRELAGGYTLASDPLAEDAARRLFSRPRAATLTPAQAETLAIVAYLQPVSRPEITRIRGVSADSAAATLLERGLIEEAGRSQFGAVLYRTSTQFLKLFGLRSLEELPDVAQWDPTPEEQAELRERLLRAGEARAGGPGRSGEAEAAARPAALVTRYAARAAERRAP